MEKEWINVNDRLPIKGTHVLAYDGKNRHIAFYITKHYEEYECCDEHDEIMDYCEENDIAYWKAGWYSDEEQFGGYYDSFWTTRNITHWMPLPQPPKK